jgi:hypothetical protein
MDEQNTQFEWKDILPDLPIRQGDLLAIVNRKSRAIDRMAVVITADCDLAQKKFGSQVACLLMQFHDDYVRDSWSEALLVNARRKAIDAANDKLRACLKIISGPDADISSEAVEEWMMREHWTKIAEALRIAGEDVKSFGRSIEPCQKALRSLTQSKAETAFDRLRTFNANLSGKSLKESSDAILKKAHDEKMPSDIFLLPGFPGDVDRPALIFLRSIVGIPPELIATRPSAVSSDSHFIRVGRLRSTFKYALSQSFGSLYSKIGFPVAYEARRTSNMKGTLLYAWD